MAPISVVSVSNGRVNNYRYDRVLVISLTRELYLSADEGVYCLVVVLGVEAIDCFRFLDGGELVGP